MYSVKTVLQALEIQFKMGLNPLFGLYSVINPIVSRRAERWPVVYCIVQLTNERTTAFVRILKLW